MNDKQDRPYVCSAPGCSQVSLTQYVCVLLCGCKENYVARYLIMKDRIKFLIRNVENALILQTSHIIIR